MDNSCFDKYARQLSSMNRAVVKGYKAPHKLVLMMAICKLVDDGTIVDNRICLNAELDNKFKELWKEFIDSDEELSHDCVAEELFRGERNVFPFKCNIANPFFHLRRTVLDAEKVERMATKVLMVIICVVDFYP